MQLGADHLPDRPRYRRAGQTNETRHSGAQQISAGELPAINRKGYEMSEAKPQDGSTVKGYRTLTAGDIVRMNRLKGVSRHFCSLLDTERGELLAVRNGPAMLIAEQAREIDEAMRSLAIARTKMQEACMWACRAVARPDADC